MLQFGLTGGIGAGKSTVAAVLRDRGAVVVDADRIAREVVRVGTEGLRELVAEFGPGILRADGSLDRGALAALAFGRPDRLAALGAIVHPRVAERTAELVERAGAGRIVVHDVPLIVENGLAPRYHLVGIVAASEATRVRRLTAERGMTAEDAWARIRAQAGDRDRRAVADLWWDNERADRSVTARVVADWESRLLPYDENLRAGRPAARPAAVTLVEPGPGRYDAAAVAARRLRRRLEWACPGTRTEHVGATAVPDLPAPDVIELLLVVPRGTETGTVLPALRRAGFFPVGRAADGTGLLATLRGADPGRVVDLDVVLDGSSSWRRALLGRDWLRADASARADLADAVRAAVRRGVLARDRHATPAPWWRAADERMARWADRTGWRPEARPDAAGR